ncbi:MAG: hypothetical protein ABIH25_01325 [Candidatus Woesearchaeota archaeon]
MKTHQNSFYKLKEKRFLAVVKETARLLGVRVPAVKFWDTECPFNEEEIAHIHIEQNLICISKKILKNMSFDKIEETASHETTHLINRSHDPNFHTTHASVKRTMWSPPAGTVHITEKSKNIKNLKRRIKKNECYYHSCKEIGKYKCKYCKKLYCKKHKKAIEPKLADFNNLTDIKGHPCLVYQNKIIEKEEKQEAKYGEALKSLLGSKHQRLQEEQNYQPNYKHNSYHPKIEKSNKSKKRKEEIVKRKKQTHNYSPKKKKLSPIVPIIITTLVIFSIIAIISSTIPQEKELIEIIRNVESYINKFIKTTGVLTECNIDNIKNYNICLTQKDREEIIANILTDADNTYLGKNVKITAYLRDDSRVYNGRYYLEVKEIKIVEEIQEDSGDKEYRPDYETFIDDKNQDIQEEILMDKCDNSIDDAIRIFELKNNHQIKILDKEEFNNDSDAEEYFNIWRGSMIFGLQTYDVQFGREGMSTYVEKIFPIVIYAIRIDTTQGISLPYALVCNGDGELTKLSKSMLGTT